MEQAYNTIVLSNPYGWVFVEFESGKRLTKDMVSFDLDREDVKTNEYGVVLFYNAETARLLLKEH